MLFTTFFLQLPGKKYNVNCAAPTPKHALRFTQDKIYNVLKMTGEHDFSQYFASCREKGDATTVATFCSVTLLLVCKNNAGIFPLLWETLSGPAVSLLCRAHPPYLMTSAGMLQGPVVLWSLRLRISFSTLSKDGWHSCFGMIGSVIDHPESLVRWCGPCVAGFVGIKPILRGSIPYS